MERAELLDKLTIVSPALATNPIIPVLTHVWFRGDVLQCHNDAISITTELKTDFVGAVPGKILIDLLSSSKAKDVELIPEKGNLLIKAASSRFRLPVLLPDTFIFDMPALGRQAFQPADVFFDGLKGCMRSVGGDSNLADAQGVTLIPTKESLNLYSTNNATISTCSIKSGGVKDRVILSEAFCKQVLELNKEGAKLEINADYSLFVTDNAVLFGKLVISDKPVDFEAILDKNIPSDYPETCIKLAAKMEDVINRACLINDTTDIGRKFSTITVKEKGRMAFFSKSGLGEVRDFLMVEETQPMVSVTIDPKHLKNGYKDFDHWLATDSAVIMSKGQAYYLIGAMQ